MKLRIYLIAAVSAACLPVFASSPESNAVVKVKRPPKSVMFNNRSDTDLRTELERNKALIGSGQENRGMMRKLRVELAKRGDKAERERLFASMRSENLVEQSDALEDAALLGDEEAIYHLAEMLNDPSPGGRVTTVAPDGTVIRSNDHAVMAPRMTAALKLSELIENPPVPPIGKDKKFYTEEDVLAWRKWWQANKSKFEASQ